jgi:hypothetical protein
MSEAPSRAETVRLALAELGEAPALEIAAFVKQKYGIKIDPRSLPLFKAVLRVKGQ